MSNFESCGCTNTTLQKPAGEPEEAADLGMPFIEPDPTHDSPKAVADEWEGWVNWSMVGA